jgi:hypothetical protein
MNDDKDERAETALGLMIIWIIGMTFIFFVGWC